MQTFPKLIKPIEEIPSHETYTYGYQNDGCLAKTAAGDFELSARFSIQLFRIRIEFERMFEKS